LSSGAFVAQRTQKNMNIQTLDIINQYSYLVVLLQQIQEHYLIEQKKECVDKRWKLFKQPFWKHEI
jgi:hypothetical protein